MGQWVRVVNVHHWWSSWPTKPAACGLDPPLDTEPMELVDSLPIGAAKCQTCFNAACDDSYRRSHPIAAAPDGRLEAIAPKASGMETLREGLPLLRELVGDLASGYGITLARIVATIGQGENAVTLEVEVEREREPIPIDDEEGD